MKKFSVPSSAFAKGFYPKEKSATTEWIWSEGPEAELRGRHEGYFEYRVQLPSSGAEAKVFLGDTQVRHFVAEWDWQEFHDIIPVGNDWSLRFQADRWNGHGASIAPSDDRKLALLFSSLELKPLLPHTSERGLQGKICSIPFGRLESLQPFAPCNRWFLRDEILSSQKEADPWNGQAAQELRRSIYDGSYRYCRRDICQAPLVDLASLEQADPPIHPENIRAIRAGATELPMGPTTWAIAADPRCNLACASCRPGPIIQLQRSDEAEIANLEQLMLRYRESVQRITFAVNGDVFFSPYLRNKLKNLSRETYPNFESVEILSNGILFDEKTLAQLRPGSDFIKRVCITVDAGDAETYQQVRNGDWARLMRNLEWMSEQRRAGRFEWLRLVFVVQKANYRSLPAFFALAEKLKVDDVLLSKLQHWTAARLDFLAHAVCEPGHPEHEVLRNLWASLRGRPWNFQVESNMFWDFKERRPTPFTGLAAQEAR